MGAALSFFVLERLVALRGGIRSRIPMIRPRLPQRPLLHGVTPANKLNKDFSYLVPKILSPASPRPGQI